jgi:hypothetical protein
VSANNGGDAMGVEDRELYERTSDLMGQARIMTDSAAAVAREVARRKNIAMDTARHAAEAFVHSQFSAETIHAHETRQKWQRLCDQLQDELLKQRWEGCGAERESWDNRDVPKWGSSRRVVHYGVFEVFRGQIFVRLLKKNGKPGKRVCSEIGEWRLSKSDLGQTPYGLTRECQREIERISKEMEALESEWNFTGPMAKTVEVLPL